MKKNYTKKNFSLAKALLISLSVLGLAFGFGQSTLHACAAESTNAFEGLDPDTEPSDYIH